MEKSDRVYLREKCCVFIFGDILSDRLAKPELIFHNKCSASLSSYLPFCSWRKTYSLLAVARWFDPKTRSRMSFSLSVLCPRALLLRSFRNARSSSQVIDLKTIMKIYFYPPYLVPATKRARNSRRLYMLIRKSRSTR